MLMKKTKSILVEGSYTHELIIPYVWEFSKLKNVIEIVGGSQPPKSDFSDQAKPDYVRLIQIRDYKSDNNVVYIPKSKAKRFVQKDEVMIGRYGPPIFQILRGLEGAYNVALMKAKPIGGIFSNEYLYYFLSNQNLYNYVESASDRTAGQSGVNKKHLEEYPVPIPPLAEQKRIVEKLDQVLAQVDTIKARLDGIPAILKRFRQSVLAAAVSGKLTEEWRGKATAYPAKDLLYKKVLLDRKRVWLEEQEKICKRKEKEFNQEVLEKKYKDPITGFSDELNLTLVNSAPKEWLISNLDSVSIAVTGKTPSTSDEKNWNGEVPFISPSQILSEGEVIEPERFVSNFAYSNTPILPVNSVLIVCIGTIGKVGFLKREAAFNQQINALIPSNSINSKFLFIWAKTLHEWLNKTSSAIVNAAIINKSRLCSAPCPVPSLEEQTEIVRLVDQYFAFADTIEKQVQKAQQRVDKLTQSILAKAFRGELVPQDPNDEPADELLKRIAAARAESEALAKAAKKVSKKK